MRNPEVASCTGNPVNVRAYMLPARDSSSRLRGQLRTAPPGT
jgi:hypothetical protein